jgi:sulfite exporter TauE/SafE
MTGALVLTAALMGLAGSAHCATMCSAGCAAAVRWCAPAPLRHARAALLAGRLVGYGAAGAVVAAFAQALRWSTQAAQWLHPFWTILQLAVVALGLFLLVRGQVPNRVIDWARHLGRRHLGQSPQAGATTQRVHLPGELKAFSLGLLWPSLPCGLLHAALLLAALTSGAGEGALLMLAFGLASLPGLLLGTALWSRLPAWAGVGRDAAASLSLRLAGAGMAATAAWPAVHAVWGPVAAWCAS